MVLIINFKLFKIKKRKNVFNKCPLTLILQNLNQEYHMK